MEVTKRNFSEVFPLVEKAVNECDFLSVDTEFSGLTNRSIKTNLYDTVGERYSKMIKNTDSFIQLQFGLCTFKYDTEAEKFLTEAFNFYLFPFNSHDLKVPDKTFSCQSSSIDFLVAQGFDFNKAFKDGIPYLTTVEEMHLKKQVNDKKKKIEDHFSPARKQKQTVSINLDSDSKLKTFVEESIEKVTAFVEDDEQQEFFLQSRNSYYRKALYEQIPKHFGDKVNLDFHKNKNGCNFVVYKGSPEQYRKQKQDEQNETNEKAFHDAVGFSRVIRLLCEKKKLTIGHNMFYDVFYTIRQYICDLPDTYEDFKSVFQCTLSNVIDTKLMASLIPFKEIIQNTGLSDLYSALKSKPFKQVNLEAPEAYQGDDETLKSLLHQAGYDAFITGYSFILMFYHLNSIIKNDNLIINEKCEVLRPYINKINMSHLYETPYLNLVDPEPEVCYDDVFHVTIPSEWKVNDIKDDLYPHSITISWINDTSCFVRLTDKAQMSSFKKSITGNNLKCKVKTFSEYKRDTGADVTTTSKSDVDDVINTKKRTSDDDVTVKSKKLKMVDQDGVFAVPDDWS